uniref:Large ribosomal subunit protein uL2c n=1 Tax=Selaginella indica TaxID=189559 RepID=A0A410KKB9_9TRAC|nr:ribosomal protein L2 [Selaginella indica]QAR48686.1 ribosomal protein L2 [Selaginella indica]
MVIRLGRARNLVARDQSRLDSIDIVRSGPHRGSTSGFTRRAGRNNRGIITSRHRGGGHKRLYRQTDFRRSKRGVLGKIATVERDPNRGAHISLVHYEDGDKDYILHPEGLSVGDTITTGPDAPITIGNALPTEMPLGTVIHNIEIVPGKGGQLARAAGTPAKPIAKEGRSATPGLPSGEVRLISQNCLAAVGRVGNANSDSRVWGKAGSKRWLGVRPSVRGVVMNPVDHPHGGGEGRAPVGRKKPSTPWGRAALGGRSRRTDRYSDNFILRRRAS